MATSLLGVAIAYGTPALMILLGFSAWTGGTLAEAIFGTSAGAATIGLLLMVFGIGIYLLELFLKV